MRNGIGEIEKLRQGKGEGGKIKKYLPSEIEAKWQKKWAKEKLYEFDYEEKNKKYYTLVEFPYSSGDLHLGHWFAFVPADVHARQKRMAGYGVFFPNGFDAFGLPAENAAIKRHIHPKDWTLRNIKNMTRQFDTMGSMIDWSRKVITCLPEYYRWNQWIFLKMLEKGLAYQGEALSNWCPSCKTTIANEHIENGKCWRCDSLIEQKEVKQWFLKITAYADRLQWPEAPSVDWPQAVIQGQNNWIGKSEGAEIEFRIQNSEFRIAVFTTRPDTLFGVTFLAVAPEHPLVKKLATEEKSNAVYAYLKKAKRKTELERKEMKEKTGVFTGSYAINPATNKLIPVWIADYVLINYGRGAVMGVPAHDQRDYEFAKKFDLPIVQVITPLKQAGLKALEAAYAGEGKLINSGDLDDYFVPHAMSKIITWIEKKGIGKKQIQYHLHDWSISRQRYWGTPVPVIHCEKDGIVPVPEKDLPVTLPYEVDYAPQGKPPLATVLEWMQVVCPVCGGAASRDPETLDTFFDSSWYYYRYITPDYTKGPFDTKEIAKFMPVDIYFGGAEHTLGHTLYARFFTKFFKDLGLVSFDEFAKKRVQHGIILGPDGYRMSKSRGNVVNPDDVVKKYGADTVRIYLCFMMPYEATAPWSSSAISGIFRFLRRVWELQEKLKEISLSLADLSQMHKTIKKVGDDIASIKFNTAVATLMEWLNYLSRKDTISNKEYKTFLLLLAPFAPYITEELFHAVSKNTSKPFVSIHTQAWPLYDKQFLADQTQTIAVQINGKLKETVRVMAEDISSKEKVENLARQSVKLAKHLKGAKIKKVIYVPGKILNFVI